MIQTDSEIYFKNWSCETNFFKFKWRGQQEFHEMLLKLAGGARLLQKKQQFKHYVRAVGPVEIP